jgi:hypothetical protein
MGLMADDKEFVLAIKEASYWGTGVCLRNMFVALLISGQLNRPSFVWNSTWEELSDDIQHKQRRLMNCQGTDLSLGFKVYIITFVYANKLTSSSYNLLLILSL